MKNKKKVAFFGIKYFPSRGGTSRVAENLILNLVDDYDITIYCYKHKDAEEHVKGVKVVQLPEIKFGNLGVFAYYFLCFCHIRFFGNYDIVHAHKIDSFFFLKGLSSKTKVIATAHEAPYKRDKWGKVAKAFFKVNERRFLGFKGVKTAISKPLCDFYMERDNVKVHFIPNGINISDKSKNDTLNKFWPAGLNQSTPFVLFAARRIMGTKGLHTMLSAYKKLNYKGVIFVAGELDNFPAYMDRIKKLSVGLNVHFLGFVNPLSTLLNLVEKSDYFVFPSETEGMSIMLLEVATTGKPILASDIPENTQVFNDDNVLFFKNKSVDDLAEKITWIENNKESFHSLGLSAKEKVASRYTWDRIVLEYKELYESM
ncbi:glycosyltransferase family 4 protein [Zobellia nedashkovskayae]|uniref:glycosyltransferase family 4 protein n=1 Tax=Zobellia nedashkovskayae TaxID=2779510 RepID=UPI00188B0993|nr:glycosyltransferase family 4 protein [Zobellia nedashkovskayae]